MLDVAETCFEQFVNFVCRGKAFVFFLLHQLVDDAGHPRRDVGVEFADGRRLLVDDLAHHAVGGVVAKRSASGEQRRRAHCRD